MVPYPFLTGGGEMSRRIPDHTWADTALGTPDAWPQSLRTAVGMVLSCSLPMQLWWGNHLVAFYNDAFFSSFSEENGPEPMPGSAVNSCWAENKSVVEPLIRQVLEEGISVFHENVPISRFRGRLEENTFWNFSYSPVCDESGLPAGVLIACYETTEKVKGLAIIQEQKEEMEFAIEATELGTWDLDSRNHFFRANNRLKNWFGFEPEEEIPLAMAIDLMAAEDRDRVQAAITEAMKAGSNGWYKEEYSISNLKTKETRRVRAKGRVWFGADGLAYRMSGTLQDISEEYKTRQEHREAQKQLLSLFEESPVAIATIADDANLTFETANLFYAELIGRTKEDIIGKPLLEALPELKGQGFDNLLRSVLTTGEPYIDDEVRVDLKRKGQEEKIYVNLTYQPRRDSNGAIIGILVVATDVTQQVNSRMKVEEGIQQMRTMVESSPFPIGVYVGREMRILFANQNIINVFGKGPDVIGKLYTEILPELHSQDVFEQLHGVYDTGIAYHSNTSRIVLEHDGELVPFYFKYSFTPLFDQQGNVYGIMNTGADVTELELARQALEKSETAVRNAIEIARLGTWNIDLLTGNHTISDRHLEMFGLPPGSTYEMVVNCICPDDRDRIREALLAAQDPKSGGVFESEYQIKDPRTGKKSIIYSLGQTHFDESGKPTQISGTAQDITIQRELQLALEYEVQSRTEQLASAVEELRAANEDLAYSNQALLHSNEELEQYAYVASHDLQEPLRKIQVFAGILNTNHELPDKLKVPAEKIAHAASRMSLLIRDLLEFSRLLKADSLMQPVDLNEIVKAVIGDFELIVSEKNAVLNIEPLPVIQGIGLQMNQLFYNLIGNALKFGSPERKLQVQVRCTSVLHAEVVKQIPKPLPHANYYRISISDNGIGFEPQYSEQIFEVFKRLQSREFYPGSGIGLALCKRIVSNHQGALYAESEPGKGATFHILLPHYEPMPSHA